MAIGKSSDFKVYDEQFFGGVVEAQQQMVDAFNAASAGAIILIPQAIKGEYEKESFFKEISNLITRRDVTSVSAVTDQALTQDEMIGVKLNRKIGPVAQALDAFKKISRDPEEFSFILGQQWGPALLAEQLNTGMAALDAALSFSGWSVDYTATGTMKSSYLVDGLAKMGDGAGRVVAWVMHSKVYFDLVKDQMADKITNISDFNIRAAAPVTMGRPVIVTDSASLISGSDYTTLGLVESAVELEESEDRTIESQLVTGLENLVMRVQGEYAYNVKVRGFAWDTANGGANPDGTAVATQTNWDKVVTSDKSIAGVRILTQ